MDHSDKAKFILALHKHSLQSYDSGGTVLQGPSNNGVANTGGNTGAQGSGFLGSLNNWAGVNNKYQAGMANLQPGTNNAQLNQAYTGVQEGLGNQQAFSQQAAAQNGFGNQSNVFAQQQALANQLQAQSLGQGPNPAQAALAQNTGNNVANQGALMASQRGASSNAGLIARQAGQQGANIQQQATGQSATLQAQQQLAAQAALANQQAQMQGVSANQIAAQGQGANAYSSGLQNEQNILQGANTAYNNQNVSMQNNVNNVNAQTAGNNQATTAGLVGGFFGGSSSALSSLLAKGGEVKKYADGGNVSGITPEPLPSVSQGPQSFVGQFLSNTSVGGGGNISDSSSGMQVTPYKYNPTQGIHKSKKQGSNEKLVPDESQSQNISDNTNDYSGSGEMLAATGGKVKAANQKQKAVKKDDSYANDKVPSLLSEGEIVLPRSVTMHPQAPQKAAEFVQAVINKRKMGKS